MPYLVTDDKLVKTNFGAPGASGKFRDQLMEFCGCLGQQLTRDTFMQYDKLHEWGCKFPLSVSLYSCICVLYLEFENFPK